MKPSRVRHELREDAGHILAVDVHHLRGVAEETGVLPVLACDLPRASSRSSVVSGQLALVIMVS
jgi:hypothetical protein